LELLERGLLHQKAILKQLVLNYDEIAQALKDTPWEVYLE